MPLPQWYCYPCNYGPLGAFGHAICPKCNRPMKPYPPPPGSDAAAKMGCLCPVLDNAHGQGIPTMDAPFRDVGHPGLHFWVNDDCPVHGKSPAAEPAEGGDA